jgi:molecular chaperone Hsp33
MLLSLGKAEASEILGKEGEVSVTCDFCNSNYSFDKIDIEQVFNEAGTAPPSATRH